MLSPDGALLAHLALAAVCWSATRLVSQAAGPSPAVARRLRRRGAFLALLLAAGGGALVGTDATVATLAARTVSGLPADVYPTVGTLVLFLGPVPLAAYAAYHGADAAPRRVDTARGSPGAFARGYALAVGPALVVTALSPAIPDGWWLVCGVALVGVALAAGTPLFVRRLVPHRPLTAAETAALPPVEFPVPVYVLETGPRGPANALAAGVLPGFRCVFVTERLVETLPADELGAILTHEFGHHRRRHVVLRLGAVAAFVLPWLGATALEVPGAFLAGLVLVLPVSAGLFRLVRWTEYDADAYAAGRVGPRPMRDALRRLAGAGLLTPAPSGVLGAFALHPPLGSRIARLDGHRRADPPQRPGPPRRRDGNPGD